MTDQQSTTTDVNGPAAEMAYGAALLELETILDELETSAVDVDHLAERVARAAHLLAHCRDRLRTVEHDVNAVVEDMSGQKPPAANTPESTSDIAPPGTQA